MNCLMQWATILSPIVGVIAIIVSIRISRKSSKDAQKQINAIHELLDVFVAVQNLNIFEVQKKYESELQQVEKELKNLDNFSPEKNILAISYHMHNKQQKEKELYAKRKEIKHNLSLIQNYINKTRK
ncbi:MAG: hypothetical protein IKY67_13900 [Paludibacteraceae bacterium]|nr:hypothetical protein [Paludibacteraceae bacterium]MBR5825220.1 hypothetical protein [Paludibacteraceae bacterium]